MILLKRALLALLTGVVLLITGASLYNLGTEIITVVRYSALGQLPDVPAATCADLPALARAADAAVPPDPAARLGLTQTFYSQFGLGYGFGMGVGYGISQMDFTRWETRRGVLEPETGSAWWQAVNGQVLRDMLEAHYLHSAGLADCGGSTATVTTWLAYLAAPTPQSWYAAHNASILAGYRAYESLARSEPVAERLMIANTLYRVLLADQMTGAPDLLIPVLGDPRGGAVALITGVASFYPSEYPLSPKEAQNSALLYLLERNPIIYAGADAGQAAAYLRRTGMSAAEVDAVRQDTVNLYCDMFPWFEPPQADVLSATEQPATSTPGAGYIGGMPVRR